MTQQWLWDPNHSIPVLLNDGVFSYLYANEVTPIAQINNTTGVIEYLHADLVGSVCTIASVAGVVVGSVRYTPYGVADQRTGTSVCAFAFATAWLDPVTGLSYLRARDYDPATAQFLQYDPAVNQAHQPYAYAGNDPLLLNDPTGLASSSDAPSPSWNARLSQGALRGAASLCERELLGTCTPMVNMIAYGTSQEGQAILGWATGLSPSQVSYTRGSPLVDNISAQSQTNAARALLIESLTAGTAAVGDSIDAGYRTREQLPINFPRDVFTYTHWASAPSSARVYAALGTYDLQGEVTAINSATMTATVCFQGSNSMTLGSAFGFVEPFISNLNAFAEATGIGRKVEQNYYWEEEISYAR